MLRSAVAALGIVGVVACGGGDAFQGAPASELWSRAQQEFAEEDWGDAIELLDRLLLTYTNFEHRAEARLMLADAFFNDERYITSQSEYTRFVQQHRGHPDEPRAALGICRSFVELSPIPQRDQTYTEQAVYECQTVVQNYTGIDDEVATEARDYLNQMRAKLAQKVFENAEFYAGRDFWDPAIIYYEAVVDDYADTAWAPRAIMGLIEAYEAIGYEDEVEEWRERLLNSYPDSPEARALEGADGGGEMAGNRP